MFALRKKKYTCLICHEDVYRPCFLNLNCNCDYNCHTNVSIMVSN